MKPKNDTPAPTDTNAADAAPDVTVEKGKTYYATRDFRDAGTERQFYRGDEMTKCSEGELLNYAAGGLVSTDKPSRPATA